MNYVIIVFPIGEPTLTARNAHKAEIIGPFDLKPDAVEHAEFKLPMDTEWVVLPIKRK